ncbi:UNVERIFIED_CONTAM: hypothetical protein PYX00_002930 [Menopon gallinae]|uniref:Uncharacterized protein n=1 Tax=Menopon gallinae TaxID=328185 RepID=A0AAW2HYH8_9NEOP
MKLLTFLLLTLSWNVDIFGFNLIQKERSPLRIKRAAPGEGDSKFNATWADKLKKDLLLSYDRYSRPTLNGSTTVVQLGCVLRHIELDEQNSIMTIHTWVQMTWEDQKLKWDSADYGGLDKMHFADHELWQPDLYPFNGFLDYSSEHFGNTDALVYNNGTVLRVPPVIYKVYCGMDFTYWPFDVQNCQLVLGPWTYDEDEVDLQIRHSKEMNLSRNLMPNSEWKYLAIDEERHSTYYSCCPKPYVDVTYNIKIQRQSPTYVALLITPATAIIIMALAVFLIPPVSTDKITLGGTTIIITCLFLLYFTQKLPALGGSTPLIVVFYSRTLYLLSVSLVISVTVINIAKNPKFSPLPWSIKRLLTGCLGKCLLINNLSFKESSKSMQNTGFKADEVGDSLPVLPEQEKQHNEGTSYGKFQQDWIMLAVAIDRIAFIIYCFIFIVFAIAYSM